MKKDLGDRGELDKSIHSKTVGQHPEQFNECPCCHKMVHRKAAFCWHCGCNVAEEAVRHFLGRSD